VYQQDQHAPTSARALYVRLTFCLPAAYSLPIDPLEVGSLRYLFEAYAFDTDRRELHRGPDVVSVAPQVFDLLDYLIRHR
jgi:DNA-binding response OmpR family regulator